MGCGTVWHRLEAESGSDRYFLCVGRCRDDSMDFCAMICRMRDECLCFTGLRSLWRRGSRGLEGGFWTGYRCWGSATDLAVLLWRYLFCGFPSLPPFVLAQWYLTYLVTYLDPYVRSISAIEDGISVGVAPFLRATTPHICGNFLWLGGSNLNGYDVKESWERSVSSKAYDHYGSFLCLLRRHSSRPAT